MAPGIPLDTVTGPATAPAACTLCGRPIGDRWLLDALYRAYCPEHGILSGCRLCAGPVVEPGGQLCPGCASTAVSDQATVRARLPRISGDLHAMGIRLTRPVRVRLVSEPEMAALCGPGMSTAAGVTVHQDQTILDLAVLGGLPNVEFGSTVAHESMHAWMVQRGFPPAPGPVVEGICQLGAYGWLRRQRDPLARLLIEAMERDSDPVYGEGFRRVRRAARRHGVRAVLATVRATGRLPGDGVTPC